MSSLAATPAAPVITSVQCATGGNKPGFQIIWQPQQGYTGPFTVIVTNSGGTAITGNTTQSGVNGATWTATETMDAASESYSVQVEAAGFTGVISDKVELLFVPVSGITTRFDGVSLLVGWTSPQSIAPAGSTQILLSNSSGSQAVVSTDGGFGQMTVGPNLRTADGEWSVYLTPQFGISSGPTSDAATVYYMQPAVEGVNVLGVGVASCVPNQVNLNLNILLDGGSAPETSFVAVLKANGATVQTSAPFTGTWTHDTNFSRCAANVAFAYPMNLAADLEVAVAQSSATVGVATGPVGVGSSLVLLAPQAITATVVASGADRVVNASITPLSGSGAPTGSRIAITGPAGFQAIGGTANGFSQTLTLTAPTIGGAYVLYGAQVSGNSVGPWTGGSTYPGGDAPTGTGLPLITSVPALTAVAINNEGVATLTWGAITDAGLSGYQVTASEGDATVASGVFSGTRGSLTARGDDLTFSVAGIAGPVSGPASTPAAVISAPPTELAAAWSATGTQCVLSWQPPTGGATPSGYNLTIYSGETVVHSATPSGASYTVPAGVLTAASGFSFRVAATAGGPPALTGPSSTSAGIVSAAPDGLMVDYDGATLSAVWNPVPGATGYRLILLLAGTESGNPWYTSAPESAFALSYDSSNTYSLAVQATGPGSTGQAATAPVFGEGFYPYFATNTAAALIPATEPSMAAHEIAIGLPQIFTTAPTDPLPSTPPFSLSAGTSPYTYVLTIAGDSGALPWTFTADPVRADLYTAYGTFLEQLDGLGATALGIQTVQNAIARAMPQTFAETLLYAYGFTGGNGYVDLKPGMVLRIEYESYLSMGAGIPNLADLNGFITSAVAEYNIVRSASGATTFTGMDAFIARLVASGGTAVTPPPVSNRKQAGAGGLIDSGYPQMQQPFLRLVYPPNFPSTAETGTPYPEFNAVLLAASKLSDLEAATTNVRAGAPAGGSVGELYFRGRTTMVPQVRVHVNGVEQYVPLGTTVGNILAQRAMEPSDVGLPLTGIRMVRGAGAALVGPPASYDAGGGNELRLDWAPSGNSELLALPLLTGDRIDL
jgi:hypothetical protein